MVGMVVKGIVFAVQTLLGDSGRALHLGAALGATLLACAGSAPTADAAARVRLSAALTPERLGRGTTIEFSFTVSTPTGQVPAPLLGIELLYPANLGLTTSGLGLSTCTAATLETLGPAGCPSQSQMGYGHALVEVPFGPEILQEATTTKVFMAHIHHGRFGLVFYTSGQSPVNARIVFRGLVLPASGPFGGNLAATLPLVPTLPGAPDAAVVQFSTTIGPAGLTYYERVGGRFLPYHPPGIVLPRTCPRGGFRFAARLTFENATHAGASTTVPCPRAPRSPALG
jgi:hypothetical protein